MKFFVDYELRALNALIILSNGGLKQVKKGKMEFDMSQSTFQCSI